jgi:hypothetical protein
MTDCAGFHVQRFYPQGSQLARVVTNAGKPALSCLLQFVVDPLAVRGGSTRARVHAHMHDRSHLLIGVWPPIERRAALADDPGSPTPESVALYRHARHPLSLDFLDDFIYDDAEGVFRDEHGQEISVSEMLDHAYRDHCRTYQRLFAWKWRLTGLPRHAAFRIVWRDQDACWWLLFNCYDIELAAEQDRTAIDPFRRYKTVDFRRISDPDKPLSSFFGFQSSRKSFFTNMLILATVFSLAYWKLPRWGILRAIYENTALTTASLVLGFLIADVVGPAILVRVICSLSRIRPRTLFITRKVWGLKKRRRSQG